MFESGALWYAVFQHRAGMKVIHCVLTNCFWFIKIVCVWCNGITHSCSCAEWCCSCCPLGISACASWLWNSSWRLWEPCLNSLYTAGKMHWDLFLWSINTLGSCNENMNKPFSPNQPCLLYKLLIHLNTLELLLLKCTCWKNSHF